MAISLQNTRFLSKYFTPCETAYILSKGAQAAQSLAALYAAKEAALKAMSLGISSVPLQEIEILHTPAGQPYYMMYGKAADALQNGHMHLSLTHEADMAIAVALLEKDVQGYC
jgi:holo-[acyl-carrier protein] synthase